MPRLERVSSARANRAVAGRMGAFITAWRARRRSRRELRRLLEGDAYLLSDVGLTTDEVERELRRPFRRYIRGHAFPVL